MSGIFAGLGAACVAGGVIGAGLPGSCAVSFACAFAALCGAIEFRAR